MLNDTASGGVVVADAKEKVVHLLDAGAVAVDALHLSVGDHMTQLAYRQLQNVRFLQVGILSL